MPVSKGMSAKIRSYMKALDLGKAHYKKADTLLEELSKSMFLNEPLDIGAGEVAELVDQFVDKHKVWKPCGITRFIIKVSQARTS